MAFQFLMRLRHAETVPALLSAQTPSLCRSLVVIICARPRGALGRPPRTSMRKPDASPRVHKITTESDQAI